MSEELKQLEKHFIRFRKISPWRSIVDICLAYGSIFACSAITLWGSWWFYPLALVLIGYQFHKLALLGHEAVHGNLFKNPKINTLVGRYLCHFPVLVSHQRYKYQHLLHHRFLGTEADPDLPFYRSFPAPKAPTLRELLRSGLLGLTVLDFLEYYSGFRFPFLQRRSFPVGGAKDSLQLLAYWCGIFSLLIYAHQLHLFLLFWFLPLYFWLPWLQLMNAIQHAPLQVDNSPLGKSRSILTHSLFEKLLFPIHVNYHGEHHLFPWIPHYGLPEVSRELERLQQTTPSLGILLRQTTLAQGLQELWIK